MLDLDSINSRRRQWEPNNPPANSEHSKASLTISRMLALTELEPTVAEFISQGLDRSDSVKIKAFIDTLKLNILDEVRHEQALTGCRQAMVDYSNKFETEAKSIVKAWQELPDNPIVTAACLENGIFFLILPIYQLFGGGSLRQTANSISADERIHVQTHRAAAQALGIKPSKELNRLRLDTVAWLSEDIKEIDGGEKWTVERMIRNSNSLMIKGVSDMIETVAASVNCPFEIVNSSIDSY